MSSVVIYIAIALAGQLAQPKDRYGGTAGDPPAAANQADPSGGNANQVIPLQGQQTEVQPQGNAAPGNSAIERFQRQNSSVAPPPSGTSPRNGASAPPPDLDPTSRGRNGSPFRNEAAASAAPPAAAPPATVLSAGMKPSTMMKEMLAPPPGTELSGNRVKLVDVVSGATSRHDQTHRIEAYWDLCSAVSDYYLSLREQEELRQLRTMLPRVGPTWQQAEAELAVRMSTSKRAAIASQLRLAGFIGRGPGSLPLPADLPHCGSYHSRYEEIFAGRPQVEAQELAALLPLRYAEVKDATSAVTRAQQWLKDTAQNDNGDGTATLRSLEFLALRRRAFVQIVRDYNRRIARYTELTTPGAVGADRLVAMLIRRDDLPTATRPSLPNGTTGRQSRNGVETEARTFADEGWESSGEDRTAAVRRDEAVEPTSAESPAAPRRERSLLVSPQ